MAALQGSVVATITAQTPWVRCKGDRVVLAKVCPPGGIWSGPIGWKAQETGIAQFVHCCDMFTYRVQSKLVNNGLIAIWPEFREERP